jgi:hypothetical protein
LGTKYLVVLCAGSTLLLAKQSLDEAPYKLSGAIAKLADITFHCLSSSYWIDNLGYITEGKLTDIFIKTFSSGFPTGRSFTTHFHINLVLEVFCRHCRVLKKKLSHHHHRAINKFSGAIAGEEKEDFCKESFARTSFTLF